MYVTTSEALIVLVGQIVEHSHQPAMVRDLAGNALRLAKDQADQIARFERDLLNLEAARDRALGMLAVNRRDIEVLRCDLVSRARPSVGGTAK